MSSCVSIKIWGTELFVVALTFKLGIKPRLRDLVYSPVLALCFTLEFV